jgi:MFS family permease
VSARAHIDMSSDETRSYRALMAVPGLRRLVASLLFSRTAAQMASLQLVLFVLAHFHSPQLSGLTLLAAIVPGLVVSPIAGAVLDRRARLPLIVLDYVVAGVALLLIAVLAQAGVLQAWSLILIAAAQSLTMPLSNSGTRSLFPLIVPRHLWDRANAVDSGGYVVATVIGPGLGGAMVALLGTTWALAVPALFSFCAAVLIIGMHLPQTVREHTGSILRDARDGLVYVVRNPGLRALAVGVSVFNLGGGSLTVAVPVLVLARLNGTSVEAGVLFAVMGVGGIVAGLITGRFDSEGRERGMLIVGFLATSCAMVLMVFAHSMVVAAVGMLIVGVANGPLDIALFSLRQRVTDPAWFGRAFAVSMSLNFVGVPIGSAVTGPVVAHSVSAAFTLAAVFTALATLAPLLMLQRQPRAAVAAGTGETRPTPASSHPR